MGIICDKIELNHDKLAHSGLIYEKIVSFYENNSPSGYYLHEMGTFFSPPPHPGGTIIALRAIIGLKINALRAKNKPPIQIIAQMGNYLSEN